MVDFKSNTSLLVVFSFVATPQIQPDQFFIVTNSQFSTLDSVKSNIENQPTTSKLDHYQLEISMKSNRFLSRMALGLFAVSLFVALISAQVRAKIIKCGQTTELKPYNRIFGGREAIPGEIPFLVELKIGGKHHCGGVIIDHYHILTAAHCISNGKMTIGIGGHNWTEFTLDQLFDATVSIKHEDYNYVEPYNDIALVRTDRKMKWRLTRDGFGSVNRICLPDAGQVYKPGAAVVSAGWGHTRDIPRVTTDVLRVVDLKIEKCDKKLVCTSRSDRKDTCRGDSGGPLFRRLESGQAELVGLVSTGPLCDPDDWNPSQVANYTNIALYIPWIQRHIKRL